MNTGYSTQELDKKRRNLEMMITEACLRGNDLVPTAEDKVMIQLWGEELFRMSEGKNQVFFDKAGRVHIMVNFFATSEARLDYLSQSNTLFNSADAGLSNVHPGFGYSKSNTSPKLSGICTRNQQRFGYSKSNTSPKQDY